MKRVIPVFIFIVLLASCKKTESDFIWEKSYGVGEAFFIKPTTDSGFVACGELEGKPYLMLLDYKKRVLVEFSSESPGAFNSAWFDTSGYTTAGSGGGKMFLMHHSPEGNLLWEKSFDTDIKIDFTNLCYTGNGTLLAIGTADPDSLAEDDNNLLFVRFDTTGQILIEDNLIETSLIAARGAAVDNEGNIFLALTRKTEGHKPKTSVAKYNESLQKLWETELYTNPDFGATGHALILDGSGNVYVTGKTELSTGDGILNNSFLASLANNGSVRWKRYLENSNMGTAIIFDINEDLMMLNRNCYIVNVAHPEDGTDAGRIRMFGLCDPYNSDALGSGIGINHDDNILVAGSMGGNFYLALKSSQY